MQYTYIYIYIYIQAEPPKSRDSGVRHPVLGVVCDGHAEDQINVTDY